MSPQPPRGDTSNARLDLLLHVNSAAMSRTLSIVFLLCFLQLVAAQFQFFDGMFGQRQQQQQYHTGASQWAAHLESISCSQYLCPGTLDCVGSPRECPCPDHEDIKCTIPDAEGEATVVCVRGADECRQIERLTRALK
ncbi:Long chronological lifespan protein 2 [Mycena indigotica]|uniref:Long chronological lifespan protein 2 n=1 Tax=Mycena indigotica TaxID=2126181 RepID=A0A8H6SM00_9AGAR|nr:Long chronological lifespan protein 2 [Mycena indigotica]KAF7301866.1 Long chronological lifespan protein 2 [Mycena indigotica]